MIWPWQSEWHPWLLLFWWHRKRGHTITMERIPGYTASLRMRMAPLHTCSCGKQWMPW